MRRNIRNASGVVFIVTSGVFMVVILHGLTGTRKLFLSVLSQLLAM